jgi:hypothetical protein
VAVDIDGYVIVGDTAYLCIRMVTPQGRVSTIAGSGDPGFSDGMGSAAMFTYPQGVFVDGDGSIIVADQYNHRVRLITPEGQVTTIAGSGSESSVDGSFRCPSSVAVDGDGNIIVADCDGHRIQKITAQLTPPRRNRLSLLPSTHEMEMAAMLEDPRFADVVFQVEETDIAAHKAVLASRSEYFDTMFSSGFREGSCGGGEADYSASSASSSSKKAKVEAAEGTASAATSSSSSSTITIGGTTPSAFKALLRYLYTDVLKFEDDDILSVMSKAKEYQLERLYNHTVRWCQDHVCVGNVVPWLIQSDVLALEELRESALQFLAQNIGAVRANDADSLLVLEERPALLMEIVLRAK